jgi:hypothetical protein
MRSTLGNRAAGQLLQRSSAAGEPQSTQQNLDVTVIDDDHPNLWLAGALQLGEVYMDDVASMVKNVLAARQVAGGRPIRHLKIVDRAVATGIEIGSDVITMDNIESYRGKLSELRGKFTADGWVEIQALGAGGNQELIVELAEIFDRPVYATTSKHFVRAVPNGTLEAAVERPDSLARRRAPLHALPTPSPALRDAGEQSRAQESEPAKALDVEVVNPELWLASWLRIGEAHITDVASMVKNVLAARQVAGLPIRHLKIVDRAVAAGIKIGSDVITIENIESYRGKLSELRGSFSVDGWVDIQAFGAGKNQELIVMLAEIFDRPVYATTGKHYVRGVPNGAFETGAVRPDFRRRRPLEPRFR